MLSYLLIGFMQPTLNWIAQQALCLFADKGELKGACINFPDNAVYKIEQCFILLLGFFE